MAIHKIRFFREVTHEQEVIVHVSDEDFANMGLDVVDFKDSNYKDEFMADILDSQDVELEIVDEEVLMGRTWNHEIVT